MPEFKDRAAVIVDEDEVLLVVESSEGIQSEFRTTREEVEEYFALELSLLNGCSSLDCPTGTYYLEVSRSRVEYFIDFIAPLNFITRASEYRQQVAVERSLRILHGWKAFGYFLPKSIKTTAFEPAYADLCADYLEVSASGDGKAWWLPWAFGFRTFWMVLDCFWVAGKEVLWKRLGFLIVWLLK